METNRLKQFCVIVEMGSLVKASQLLHITHSALSKSMKYLQAEIGFSLFCSSGRGISPTEEGLIVYKRAKEFLEQENRLFKLDKEQISLLRIGTVEIFLLAISEQFTKNFFKNNIITLLDLDPGNIEQMIIKRQLDYGITYVPTPKDQLEILEIGTYRLGCFYLKNTFEKYSISEIPFVVPSQALSNNLLGIKERDGWVESIYPRHKQYFVNLLSTALELTLQGLCAIYMPVFLAKKINLTRKVKEMLVEHHLPQKKHNWQRVFLLKHITQKEDMILKQLINIIKEMIKS